MKLIMESWRHFIKENKAAELERILKTFGLHAEQSSEGFEIVLVDINKSKSRPIVVGTLSVFETEQPCIPKTYEVGAVAIDPSFSGTGLGTYIYEVAAYLIYKNFNGGITSDHTASTTNPAKKVWDRLSGKFNYIKRKTPKGPEKETYDPNTGEVNEPYKGQNDEFDYVGWDPAKLPFEQDPNATPDPLDDCEGIDPSYAKAAIDNSLQIPPDRIAFVKKIVDIQIQNYQNYLNNYPTDQQQNIMNATERGASRLFAMQYDPDTTGIYGKP